LFLLIKSYANWLTAELSQLCYDGVLRAVALGSTDGLSTWRVAALLVFQAVIVPVGRIALGRILNVVGSVIDRWMELSLSCHFQDQSHIESTSDGFIFLDLSEAICWRTKRKRLPCSYSLLAQNTIATSLQFNNTISLDWTCYMSYLLGSLSFVTSLQFEREAVIAEGLQSLFYNTDTLFAQMKPIHKTPVSIMTLSTSMSVFETGIKVVDLLTPIQTVLLFE